MAQDLATLSPAEQSEVMAADVAKARNPSAMVTSLVRAVKDRASASARVPAFSASASPVDAFIQKHNLDELVREEFLTLSWAQQQEIMNSDLVAARNPSAIVWSRIKLMKGAGSGAALQPVHSAGLSGLAEELAVFVQEYQLDERVAQDLVGLSEVEQQEVLGVDLTSARNPSAFVTKVIRDVQERRSQAHPQQARPPQPPSLPVEDFVRLHNLDVSAAEGLRALPPADQRAVMAAGFRGARDSSAAVRAQIAARRAGAARHPAAERQRQVEPTLDDRVSALTSAILKTAAVKR